MCALRLRVGRRWRFLWVSWLVVAVFSGLAAGANGSVYWGNYEGARVGRANLDGTSPNQSFISGGTNAIRGVAVDRQYVYWANFFMDTIGRANLDGSGATQNFITSAAGSGPDGVAVDGQHVYWASFWGNGISRANLDGSGLVQSFVTGTSTPSGVAIDGQHIYWTNTATGTIGRANLDATGVNQSFITGATTPYAVAVDGQHIYWTNATSTGTIGRANLDGSSPNQSFITTGSYPFGLAVDGWNIYWTNNDAGTIGRANLDGSSPNQSFVAGVAAYGPWGVAVDLPPLIKTSGPSPTIKSGGAVHTLVELSGGHDPRGTMTFRLYGPDDTTCAQAPVFTSSVPVFGNAWYPSAEFVPTQPGTYRWTAGYSGDSNNRPTSTVCNAPGESVTVLPPDRTLSIKRTGPGTVISADGLINCGATCSHTYPHGTPVTLYGAASLPGWTFAGWSGAGCTGIGACQLTLAADTTVNATFSQPGLPFALTKPRIIRAVITNKHFLVAKQPTAIRAAKMPRGTQFRLTLSTAAKLEIAIKHSAPGLRKGGRCVAPTKALKLKHAKRCTRAVTDGTLTRADMPPGDSTVRFSGRIGRRALRPRNYTALLTATNTAGRSKAIKLSFTVVR